MPSQFVIARKILNVPIFFHTYPLQNYYGFNLVSVLKQIQSRFKRFKQQLGRTYLESRHFY